MFAVLATVRGPGTAACTLTFGPYASAREADEARRRLAAEAGGGPVAVQVVPLVRYPARETGVEK